GEAQDPRAARGERATISDDGVLVDDQHRKPSGPDYTLEDSNERARLQSGRLSVEEYSRRRLPACPRRLQDSDDTRSGNRAEVEVLEEAHGQRRNVADLREPEWRAEP